MASILKIRAHHLLCIQGFQGYGYNQGFVDNMKEVIKSISSNPDLEVEIIDECDVICSFCPYNEGGVCQKSSDQKVKDMDMYILRRLGLRKGANGRAKDILHYVRGLNIQDICSDCEWKEKCLYFVRQMG